MAFTKTLKKVSFMWQILTIKFIQIRLNIQLHMEGIHIDIPHCYHTWWHWIIQFTNQSVRSYLLCLMHWLFLHCGKSSLKFLNKHQPNNKINKDKNYNKRKSSKQILSHNSMVIILCSCILQLEEVVKV